MPEHAHECIVEVHDGPRPFDQTTLWHECACGARWQGWTPPA